MDATGAHRRVYGGLALVLVKSAVVTAFLSVSLFFLAGCVVLGTFPPSILAAKARKPAVAVMVLLTAASVVYVLVAAAASLRPS